MDGRRHCSRRRCSNCTWEPSNATTFVDSLKAAVRDRQQLAGSVSTSELEEAGHPVLPPFYLVSVRSRGEMGGEVSAQIARIVADAVDEARFRRRRNGSPITYMPGDSTTPPSWRTLPLGRGPERRARSSRDGSRSPR